MNSNPVIVGRGHTDSVTSLSLSGSLLASGGEDGNVYIWSLNQSSFPVFRTPRLGPCATLKFSVEKPSLLFSAHDREIASWDVRNLQEPINRWTVNEEEINSIDVLDGDARISSADDSGVVLIIDSNTGAVVRTLKKHDNICSSAKFRPSRMWQLISGGLDCRVIVSDWKGTGLGVIIFEMDEIVDTTLSGDSQSNSPGHPYHQLLDHSTESDVSSDDYAEEDYDVEESTNEETDFVLNPSINIDVARHRTNVSSPSPSSGMGSDGRSEHQDNESNETDLESQTITSILNQPLEEPEILSESSPLTYNRGTWRFGLPINPPMVHTIACSASGDYVAAGLESNTIELFSGCGKRLNHQESLYGHSGGVSALHFLKDSHLISGGNDRNLFVWTLASDITGHHIFHGQKVCALEGVQLDRIFVADFSPLIQVLDLSIR